MAIAASYPAIKPSLSLDFANVGALDPRVTFTRSTTGTYYDGVTTAKAEENLLLYSQEFDNAYWSKVNVAVTADTTTAPDGTSTADTVNETTPNSQHYLTSQSVSFVSGAIYTLSVFFKKGAGATAPDIIQLTLPQATFGITQYANYNLSTASVGTTGAGATASIVSVGSGWYRLIYTATCTSTGLGSVGAIVFTNNDDSLGRVPSYAGATTSDIYIWGAQLEQR